MPPTSSIALVVHGHFYQPPREDPWTDHVPREASAEPFHDWNQRIAAECYRANAFARLFTTDDRVRAMVNNYERISFNFGPTLARWLHRHDALTESRIREGDLRQRQAGAGGALAQVWAHPITPLLSSRDRRTQIRWGLDDFERRFGRKAAGIWLPETAVDAATLEALIEARVEFTILAPEQIAAVRAPGRGWTSVNRDTLDTGRAYRWPHSDGSGRSITLAVFNGPLSRDLAFGTATRDAATFVRGIKSAAEQSAVTGRRLVLAASDGELYGHHKKFADLALAYVTSVEAAAHGIEVMNLGTFLRDQPATWEADLAKGPGGEGTAWSCQHGLGRWQRHCGCAIDPATNLSQAWRAPLREALDHLRDAAAAFHENAAGDLFEDPWAVRDSYGTVVDEPPAARMKWIAGRLRGRGRGPARAGRAHRLLELQRGALLMYASCGWFFDDVAGIESAIVIRQAAHVLDQWQELGGRPPVSRFLDILAGARSNVAALGTGADVYKRALAERMTPARAVAATVFRELLRPAAGRADITPGFTIKMAASRRPGRRPVSARATATVESQRTGITTRVSYTARLEERTRPRLTANGETVTLSDLPLESRDAIIDQALDRLLDEPPSLTTCRAALALPSLPTTVRIRPAGRHREAFARLLIGLLAALPARDSSTATMAVVLDLIDHAAIPDETHLSRQVEELLWQWVAPFVEKKQVLPAGLQKVAERMGFGLAVSPRDPSLQ